MLTRSFKWEARVRYRVNGVDRVAGRDVTMIVDAESPEAAEAIAGRRMLVAEVIAEPEALAYQPVDDGLAAIAAAAAQPGVHRARVVIPDYTGILTGAMILRVLSVVAYVVAGLVLVGLMMHWAETARAKVRYAVPVESFEVWVTASYLLLSIFWVVVGAVLGLYASLSVAIRDIARNSFGR